MSKILKYGKKNILTLKSEFIQENDSLKEDLLRLNSVYATQSQRTRCKICDGPLPLRGGFNKHGVVYVECSACRHLNGRHEDTDRFCGEVYGQGGGANYGRNYVSVDKDSYQKRVEEVYLPKARFLAEALQKTTLDRIHNFRFCDLGAGSGYFVSALHECGFQNVIGYEISESQISLANQMCPNLKMSPIGPSEITSLARDIDANIISLIGVLEHLQEPRNLLASIRENRNVNFLYVSVPLFSPSVVFEALFPEIMPRHLAGGHTHLFCESSLNYMAKEFGLESVAEWWFGSDVMDLFRSIVVQLGKTQDLKDLQEFAAKSLFPVIDDLQLEMDKKHLSSEVHVVYKVCH